MTQQATFKKRVRARMAQTGEKYGAARRVLIEKADHGGRTWAHEPEMSNDALAKGTGRGWNDWCDLIDADVTVTGDADVDHKAIVAYVHDTHDVTYWWAQGITIGWEHITGRRLPFQQSDGLFGASRSRTMTIDADGLRAMLLDEGDRADLFGGLATELRSKPTSKSLRIGMPEGLAEITIEPKDHGRARVAVQHTKLTSHQDVPGWQDWWTAWLDALNPKT